jgi:hypothetical protein
MSALHKHIHRAFLMKKTPYVIVLLAWLFLALFSACSSQPHTGILKLASTLHFSGVSVSEADRLSPLSALCFDENGTLYTLMQDSGRITAFDATGMEIISFARENSSQSTPADPVEGIVLGSFEDKIYMLDGKNAQVQAWTKSGNLLRTKPVLKCFENGQLKYERKLDFPGRDTDLLAVNSNAKTREHSINRIGDSCTLASRIQQTNSFTFITALLRRWCWSRRLRNRLARNHRDCRCHLPVMSHRQTCLAESLRRQ